MDIEILKTVESLDVVPEALRGFYSQGEDGKYTLEDVGGLRRNRDTLLSEKRKHAVRIAALKAKGFDIDKLSTLEHDGPIDLDELLKLAEEKRAAAADPKGEEKEIPPAVKAKWEKERDTAIGKEKASAEQWKKVAEDAQAKLKSRDLRDAVRKAASAAGVDPERMEDALELTRKFHRLEDNGDVTILDESGDPTDMSLEKFWKEALRERKSYLYAGTASSGSGAAASTQKQRGAGGVDFHNLPPAERMAYGRKRGGRSN